MNPNQFKNYYWITRSIKVMEEILVYVLAKITDRYRTPTSLVIRSNNRGSSVFGSTFFFELPGPINISQLVV